ncbi:hypothetical protein [Legionella nagasakiensis]|uniref:hypothetical protein n=1 Tax=Legionella nagasakiensis TaxID=535290 RepID=UPI001055295D|nr:hypothetical protein [Legionella nagasakiensis]
MKLFMLGLSFVFPALVLLICDNPGGALIALILQATIIGWIPATIWALRVVREEEKSSSGRK